MRRLVFATQKLDPDDPVLAATAPMARALAARVDELVVLCDSAVPGIMPENTRVHEFGEAPVGLHPSAHLHADGDQQRHRQRSHGQAYGRGIVHVIRDCLR